MYRTFFSRAAILIGALTVTPIFADVQSTPRGAVIDTDRLRMEIVDGAVVQLSNKLTNENYLRRDADIPAMSAKVPSGLGTVNGEPARKAAEILFQWPWNEMAEDFKLPCQHAPSSKSKVDFKQAGKGGTLTYTGLTGGGAEFADETFSIQIEIDEATSDVLLTPEATSPREGVYGASILFAPTRRLISIEAPIFDGVRLTSDVKSNLWVNVSPAHWDYPLIALNGEDTGAIGIWAQDETRRYKSLFYLADGKGVATSFCTLETPPFFTLKKAKSIPWRVQAFDKSWAQVADRYRQWRDKNLKIAPRPEWTKHISFVNGGVNTSPGWLDALLEYLEYRHPERTATFLPVIRAAAFDTKHYDNRPYPKFKEETPAWKKSGAKTMAYLQPMIMWGPFPADMTEEDKKVVALSGEANTLSAFTNPPVKQDYVDQHHLGHAAWQAWFLKWVKEYVQQGADGIYHDQSYPTPIDGRGPVNGMNSAQGMAEYFYNAATQNPDAIHATEHLQEANVTGASLGIGSGVLWGTAPMMRMQRIRHGSPISNALHYPLAVTFGFPHFSDLHMRNDAHMFHWGIDLMERRGDIAGLPLQHRTIFDGKTIPFAQWSGEAWLDRTRTMTFVDLGLRPVFPLDWDRAVRTYFKGINGEDVRYEETPFGSEFVQYKDKTREVIYGRVTGVTDATTPLSIPGWFFYNDRGPSGLNPDQYYVTIPKIARPKAWFSPGFSVVPGAPLHPTLYESYVSDCAGNEDFLSVQIRPLASVGKITTYDKILLHSEQAPVAVFVDGQPVTAAPKGAKTYEIGFATPANIVVFLKKPPGGFDGIEKRSHARFISSTGSNLVDTAWLSQRIVRNDKVSAPNLRIGAALGSPGVVKAQLYVPLLTASDKPETLSLVFPAAPGSVPEIAVNGQVVAASNPFKLTLKPGVPALLTLNGAATMSVALEPPAPPSTAPAKP